MKRLLAIAKLLLANTLAGAVALWVLAVIAVLVLPSSCTSRRPPDAELLQRHLGLESTNGFARIEINYQPAREWTARFYLEAPAARIEQLLAEGHFIHNGNRQANETIRWVAFPAAPALPPVTAARFYFKAPKNSATSYRAVVGTNGMQLWLRVDRL
jgi:hypothetical protein